MSGAQQKLWQAEPAGAAYEANKASYSVYCLHLHNSQITKAKLHQSEPAACMQSYQHIIISFHVNESNFPFWAIWAETGDPSNLLLYPWEASSMLPESQSLLIARLFSPRLLPMTKCGLHSILKVEAVCVAVTHQGRKYTTVCPRKSFLAHYAKNWILQGRWVWSKQTQLMGSDYFLLLPFSDYPT